MLSPDAKCPRRCTQLLQEHYMQLVPMLHIFRPEQHMQLGLMLYMLQSLGVLRQKFVFLLTLFSLPELRGEAQSVGLASCDGALR